MGFYADKILPRVVNWGCSTKPVMRQREKIVPQASGRVLEIGIGSGLNLAFYDPEKTTEVIGLDPSGPMRKMAEKQAARTGVPVRFLALEAEEIPLEAQSVDTVLVTYSLCTIPDPARALAGMRRVCKPGGMLLFCEHGAAPDARVRRWQQRIEPLWSRLFGGCHLTRDIPALIGAAGFALGDVETMYLPGTPKIAGFNYWGRARASG